MGFSILKEFPSRFLSGEELLGLETDVVIRDVKKEKAYSPKTKKEEPVIVVYFEGKTRGVRLGKERAIELKNVIGSDDTDMWKGKTVRIYSLKRDCFGKEHDVIHFKGFTDKKKLSKELDAIAVSDSQ